MARNTQAKSAKQPILPDRVRAFFGRWSRRLWGALLIALALAGFAALAGFDAADPTLNHATGNTEVGNWLGLPGAYAADLLLQTLGLAAIALVVPLAGWGWRIVALKGLPKFWMNLLALPFAAALTAMFAASFVEPESWPIQAGLGGVVGHLALSGLDGLLRDAGAVLPVWLTRGILGALALAAIGLSLGIDRHEWSALGRAAGRGLRTAGRALFWVVRAPFKMRVSRETGAEPRRSKRSKVERSEPKLTADPPAKKPGRGADRVAERQKARPGKRAARESQPSFEFNAKGFRLPTLDLLAQPKVVHGVAVSDDALEQNARLLEGVLDDFGIKGDITRVRPGPVVTLYELEPAPGTKSSRVIGLADDIARSMSAISARVAVVPGRNAIGIELPNSRRETVYLRELLTSADYEKSRASLALALGKDIGGTPVIVDLETMPHLLIAGTTGSGKSVAVNAMILSLLYRLPPDRCKLILVDPKMLELIAYDDIPHLLTPVVTEPKKAVVALKWAVREMEDRYRAMSKLGVRNIAAYNTKVAEANAKGEVLKRRVQTGFDRETGEPVFEEEELAYEPLPLIVVVIDEMADLMLIAGKDMEAIVQRLAQMARAAGIHMIMATQRPSVDVVTGTIKANFPIRISFQVTSKIDSRTILNEQGAEQLLGRGDMLYMSAGSRVARVHGPFVSDEEVEAVVAMRKRLGSPEYLAEVTEEPEEGYDSPFIPGGNGADEAASLYDKAVDIVSRDRKASTSYIQRRLKIGYNRAATLIEEMEANGVISAPNHAGKREVLTPDHGESY